MPGMTQASVPSTMLIVIFLPRYWLNNPDL